MAGLSLLIVLGVAWDIRRHSEGISSAEEGFSTPEHVFIYSMVVGVAAAIGLATALQRRAGATWLEAVPPGYGWGVVGVIVFAIGGLGDVLWHGRFGFEQGFEALVSPSHLTLAVGSTLLLAAPLRASWLREDGRGGLAALPAVVSAGLVLTVVVLFGAFLNPITQLDFAFGAHGSGQASSVASIVVFPLALVGLASVIVRRFDVPTGALTVVFLGPGSSRRRSTATTCSPSRHWQPISSPTPSSAFARQSPRTSSRSGSSVQRSRRRWSGRPSRSR